MNKKFVFFCAGEDSGDILGAEAVSAISLWGFQAIGIGGPRMQKEGLKLVENFENFAVSGIKDVLTHYLSLRRSFLLLKKTIENPYCIAVVLVDYPGLNMKLVELSKSLSKPILYIAPPQIWAWKSKRANLLHDVSLGVLYDFEREAYFQFDCPSVKIEHPLLKASVFLMKQESIKGKDFLFLPGSRRPQLHRNMPLYISMAKRMKKSNPNLLIKFVASREDLLKEIRKWNSGFEAIVAPENSIERATLFSKAQGIVAPPGSGILEASLVGTKALACSKIDLLTYIYGRLLVRTPFFTLPNLLLSKKIVPEFLSPYLFFYKKRVVSMVNEFDELEKEDLSSNALALHKTCEGKSIKCLTLEFLMNVFNRNS